MLSTSAVECPAERRDVAWGTHMKAHQFGELFGICMLLASTAMQLFYLAPLKRDIEWRMATFSIQQAAQIQLRTSYDNQLSLLKLMNAPADQVKLTEEKRDRIFNQYKNSDGDISDVMLAKQDVESYLELVLIALFGIGSFLTGLGRYIEMRTAAELQKG